MSFRRSSSMTRRQWTTLLAATPLAAQVTSRVPPQGTPAAAPSPAPPSEKLQKAYADVQKVSRRLSEIEMPMDIEPAFVFKT